MSKLLSAALFAALFSQAHAASELYCCQNPANGRRICSDSLPEQCRGRAYQVLDSAGNVSKDVAAPLTAEERTLQNAENQRRKQQEDGAREQRRKDQALLDTYASVQDISLNQRKAEAEVKQAIGETQARIDTARSEQKKLAGQAEFYRKRTLPPDLDKNIRAVENELKVQQELLDVKKHDFETIRSKYDADRQRYIELTRGKSVSAQNGR